MSVGTAAVPKSDYTSPYTATGYIPADPLAALIDDAREQLLSRQQDDGHFIFELEADATIPSEYILLYHFLGEPKEEIEPALVGYLKDIQGEHGGWPLFHKGDFNISASVKAYYAMKIAGEDIDAPHMKRAREAILAHGGAETSNVFTRIMLAMFEQAPWTAIPCMPVEIMLLPKWFPFHMSKISYWSRTVIAPLLVLTAKRATAINPKQVGIRELFKADPFQITEYNTNPTGHWIGEMLLRLDKVLHKYEPKIPGSIRAKAIQKAVDFIEPRLNGEDGLGAIFPAMANTVMMYHVLGVDKDEEKVVTARRSVDKLLEVADDKLNYCQPCVSPVWDTGLAAHALLEAGLEPESEEMTRTLDWLLEKEITDVTGDWVWSTDKDLKPGGWAFQYGNDYYPDVDDTAVVAMAMHRTGNDKYKDAIKRAEDWILGMQSWNGGWGAFDKDNTHFYLNHIPFADHGALLDPPTVDVSARCLSLLAQLGYSRDDYAMKMGMAYLRREQEEDGSWFGRWGANYIYGTWSALCAFNAIGEPHDSPVMRKGADYLKAMQREDGGWGEDLQTYEDDSRGIVKESTASQTAWAVLGLMAAGEVESDAVRRGIEFLMLSSRDGARWDEEYYTGTGFPKVFYLKYHGYASYFPLWAISRYQHLMRKNDRTVQWGM